jgi:hypothetical protein
MRFPVFTAMKNLPEEYGPLGCSTVLSVPFLIEEQSAVNCLPVISYYSLALKMEAISFSETSVETRPTRCCIQEDDILHSHLRENLKSYNNFPDYDAV